MPESRSARPPPARNHSQALLRHLGRRRSGRAIGEALPRVKVDVRFRVLVPESCQSGNVKSFGRWKRTKVLERPSQPTGECPLTGRGIPKRTGRKPPQIGHWVVRLPLSTCVGLGGCAPRNHLDSLGLPHGARLPGLFVFGATARIPASSPWMSMRTLRSSGTGRISSISDRMVSNFSGRVSGVAGTSLRAAMRSR
jgi:hypothetical protein